MLDEEESDKPVAPNTRLLRWIQSRIPDLPINNFTSNWKDGRTIGALVDAVAPGLCPEWKDWKPDNALSNTSVAMDLADNWLNIPQLIKPEEMISPNIDELSMMTYLSQYPHATLKEGAPLKQRTTPGRIQVYGPGIEPTGPVIDTRTNFTVETLSPGKVDVVIEDPKENKIPVDVMFDKDGKFKYSVSYIPKSHGPHKIRVFVDGRECSTSPYVVNVGVQSSDHTEITASGPGLLPDGTIVNKSTFFEIYTKNAGNSAPQVIIKDPQGSLTNVPAKLFRSSSDVWRCEYTPSLPGLHSINVAFAGKPIPGSPYSVNVSPVTDSKKKCKAYGRGILPNGVRVRDNAEFTVITKGVGDEVPGVNVIAPGGVNCPIHITKIDPTTYKCNYTPTKEGRHVVTVTYGGRDISKAPFEVNVGPYKESAIKAFGPGLHGGVVDYPAKFTVNTNGETGGLGFSIEGPSKAKIMCYDHGDGTADVSYLPTAPGQYAIHILCENEDIPNSPYVANILPKSNFDPDKVKVYGPGVQAESVPNDKPTNFTVDVKQAGQANLEVIVQDVCGKDVPVRVEDNHDGKLKCHYTPTSGTQHIIMVNYGGVAMKDSPFRMKVDTPLNPALVSAYGPGLEKGIKSNTLVDFDIDCRRAGPGDLNVSIVNSEEEDILFSLKKKDDGTYTVHYLAPQPGNYFINLKYGGLNVPYCPIKVNVQPHVDVSKIKVDGLARRTSRRVSKCNAITYSQQAKSVCSTLSIFLGLDYYEIENDTTRIENLLGLHSVIHALSLPLPLPFPKSLNIRVNIFLQQFHVITQDVGKVADIQVTITAPSGNRIKAHVVPTNDGYVMNFTPTELGEYLLGISFGGEPISNQPYRLTCVHGADPGKVRASGSGLTHGIINKPAEFVIDTRGAGQGGLGVTVEGPCEAAISCRDNGDGTCSVAYLPTEIGDYGINITFNDKHIPGSPFQANVVKDVDLSKIKITGNGIQPHGTTESVTLSPPSEEGPTMKRVDGRITRGMQQSPRRRAEIWAPSKGGSNFADLRNLPKRAVTEPKEQNSGIYGRKGEGGKIGIKGLPIFSQFRIDTRAMPKSENDSKKVSYIIKYPSGGETQSVVTLQEDGTYYVCYVPFEEGCHTIDILYDNIPVPGSPFSVNVERMSEPRNCKAYGPGLQEGIVNKSNTFTVETKDAGNGGLALSMEGTGEVKMTCKDNYDGSCSVEYIPTESGDYECSIKFAEQHIPGSPFQILVVDEIEANNVTVYGTGLESVRENVLAKFMVDTSKCSPAQLDITLKSDKGQVQTPLIKDRGDGLYEVAYHPTPIGSNLQVGVTYDGKNIPGSPFKPKVLPTVEPNKVVLSGPGVAAACTASFPVDFVVDTSKAGYGNLEVQVLGPDQVPRKVEIQDLEDGKYKVRYLPDDCGRYQIKVRYGGVELPSCPILVQSISTGKADECKIKKGIQRTLTQGEEQCITIDTMNAGHGAVTCRIKSTSGSEIVDIDIEDNGDGTVSIYYTVADAGDYTLSIKFGGQPVPGGFYTFTVSYYCILFTISALITVFYLFSPYIIEQSIIAEVKMPSGNMDKPIIEDNHDGTVSIRYDPKEEGQHEVIVKFNGVHVQGSPFKFHVDSIGSGYVTAYGPGLVYGVCGEPGNFVISTKGAGAGGLSLAVEGPSKTEISCHDNKDGTVSVSYLPTAPGEYKISVKFGDKDIKGSPYVAKITGEGRKRNQISVGASSEVQLPGKVTDSDIKSLNASITAPSGLEEPCFLKMSPNGNMCVSFTPRESGEHTVAVKKMGNHIPNSPFKINVSDREVGDAKKVKVSGQGLKEGKTQVENSFLIDTRNAGFGGLSLSIEGPSKAEIQCKDNEDGTLNIFYKPTEPGYYIMNLKYADHHVEGSPFTVKVSGEGSNRQREKIQRQREAVPITEVGSQCKLTFKMPGITSFDLAATVTSPGGVTEDAEVKEVEDGLYAVAFVPKELGVHTVSVRYKEMHIPGSPFQFTVGPLRDSGAHRVHAGGPGLERGEQGEPCEFNVWTREAGAGTLAISVEGPSRAKIDFKDRKDGSCYVSYVVSEPGDYRVGIKFNDQHIPDSPHKVYISPAMGDAHKLEVARFPESGVQPDKPTTFLVRKNGAKGELDAKIVSPSGTEDDCFIQAIDGDTYSVRFMAHENGIHNIHIKFNGVHIAGSPFPVKVGKVDADPAAVHAYGNGLKDIKTGQKTDFIIDTCNAGTGSLNVTVDGPSKVAMDCTEVEEGYKVRYTPLVPGDYYISVKYNGYHIVGSPFKVPCTGADLAEKGAQETSSVVVETVQKISKSKQAGPVLPLFKSDASKVTSKGMGLKKAYLGKQNQFTVNAGDAGNNILYVAVYGPKGPCDEITTKHTGRNNYNVSYMVRERGEYIILVKWGDEHISGSPYKVEV
ncbi:Filamin-A [Dufourea novaeangliae]|uniref:Filamin-A n=1 Tax=Dufourea novaeangliae TaxID=178035 RepID=A0A154PJR5_DUFNO|nr:Filamin-A [Dufourea novaeangliae]